jgi:6-phosphogluconolactonase (cycloisomerase 2 family)
MTLRRAYVGTYCSPRGPEGGEGKGEGIYLFDVEPATGVLSGRDVVRNGSNPSWLALDSSGSRLYSANETDAGTVSAYVVDRSTGSLSLLNTESSQGADPCHLSIHPSGKYVLVANYTSGSVAVLPIGPDGRLGAATDVRVPPCGAQDRPHAHMIQSDTAGRFVLSADRGLDRIFVWCLDLDNGTLRLNDPPAAALPSGHGPRHFAFHPDGRMLYSLQERSSTLAVFDYDPGQGTLSPRQTVSTLPEGCGDRNLTSGIAISADGRFVYTANRGHDSIAWFGQSPDGTLIRLGEAWVHGAWPRSITLDPDGSRLYCCNQNSNGVACFLVDRETGALSFTGLNPIGTPAAMLHVDLPVFVAAGDRLREYVGVEQDD